MTYCAQEIEFVSFQCRSGAMCYELSLTKDELRHA